MKLSFKILLLLVGCWQKKKWKMKFVFVQSERWNERTKKKSEIKTS